MTPATGSAPDPYLLNEYPPQGKPNGMGYYNIRGRTEVSSIISAPTTTKIVIVDGQSEHATANGTMTYSTVNAASNQLNIYDGAIYAGADPVLGASDAPNVGYSSMVMRFADRLITQGRATRVIMVPIAIGGTPWAIYEPTADGSLFTRVRCAIRRLAALGLEPDAIITARGATDAGLGTSAASMKTSVWAWADGIRDLGCTAPIYLGKFSGAGVTSNAIRTAMDNALDAGRNIVEGYDGDTYLTIAGGYRLADTVHLSDTGLTKSGNDWADLVFPT